MACEKIRVIERFKAFNFKCNKIRKDSQSFPLFAALVHWGNNPWTKRQTGGNGREVPRHGTATQSRAEACTPYTEYRGPGLRGAREGPLYSVIFFFKSQEKSGKKKKKKTAQGQ